MSHPVLGSFSVVAALLLLGSAYLLAGESPTGAVVLALVALGLLLSAVRMLGRRQLGRLK